MADLAQNDTDCIVDDAMCACDNARIGFEEISALLRAVRKGMPGFSHIADVFTLLNVTERLAEKYLSDSCLDRSRFENAMLGQPKAEAA
ncbi:hypothetical protein [Chitinasiproducens palmae]|uniref:hypothetical protein n=1 Tax=Chitinasiproducens palmae TaxID=1770053 RepID=UPI0011137BA0|nr:hypothetical protein [Chitinasiproducens palmae]